MPRPDVGDERRPQIMDAAVQVFIHKGYRNATMPDIARAAGLSIGGVYWYYKSKDQIVTAILNQCFQRDLDDLARMTETDAPAVERIHAFLDGYIASYDEYAWLNPVGVEFYGEAVHDATVRQLIQNYLANYRRLLVNLIEQGIRRGEFQAVDPVETANALLGLEEGLSLLMTVDPQNVRWHTSFKTAVTLMLAGLTRKEEQS